MATPKQQNYENLAESLIEAFNRRGIEGYYCVDKEDALSTALRFLTPGCSVSWGGSVSCAEIGLFDALKTSDCVLYDRSIRENGKARLNLNLEANTYIITAYNTKTGEQSSNTITIKPRIVNNSDITKYYRNDTQYEVTILDDNGNPVKAGEVVTFNINGVFYERKTNENGTAKLNINLEPKTYIITTEYKNCRAANTIKVLPVLSAKDLTMKYRDGSQFKATLVDGQGNPYYNQTVMFNVNGVFYSRQTDINGTARLNINLMAGKYIITSSYNASNIANTITINL